MPRDAPVTIATRFAFFIRRTYAPARAPGSHACANTLLPNTEESLHPVATVPHAAGTRRPNQGSRKRPCGRCVRQATVLRVVPGVLAFDDLSVEIRSASKADAARRRLETQGHVGKLHSPWR